MGTSAGANPVTGNHPLIPAWIPDEQPATDQSGDVPADGAANPSQPTGPNNVASAPQQFSDPRSTMTSAVRLSSTGSLRGGGGGGAGLGRSGTRATPAGRVRKAISQYVGARGGPAGVAQRLGLASDIGARLFEALDRIARDGFDAALAALGLRLDERSAGAVADALMTLVCAEAAGAIEGVLDENMARCACDETFISLYEQGISLTSLTPEDVPAVIQSFAINAASLLITRDIATMVVDSPRTEEESRTLQMTLKSVIESSMRLELPAASGRTIRQVRDAIGRSYRDAFQILQAAR